MNNMEMKEFVLDFFNVNNYLIWCPETLEAVLIDSGGYEQKIVDFVNEKELKFKYILNTHGHLDHIGGNDAFKNHLGIKSYLNKDDSFLVEMLAAQYKMFGFSQDVQPPKIDFDVQGGDIIKIGTLELEVIHTPGHTPGGVSYYNKKDKKVFVGDVLFAHSVGRTDLPGGSYQQLKDSIQNKLFALDPETVVYPGHGPTTTIREEQENNPFFGNKAVLN